MQYYEALEYINYVSGLKSMNLDLGNIRELCRTLGDPQKNLKFVHVAGTNGKGSTVSFIFTILLKSGYNVGKYTSPTIKDYLDHFQVNDEIMSESAFVEIIEEVKNACNDMVKRGLQHPTIFEVETAIAFLYFDKMNCDIVVLETGMGGIDDATNIIETTVLSVFTSISIDHVRFLGNTLEQIAENKCGIIKNGVPVASGIQKDEVNEVIKKVCNEKHCKLRMLHEKDISNMEYGLDKQSFKLNNKTYNIKLLGTYQIENAALAVNCVNILKENGFDMINEESISDGLFNTLEYGRFQIINENPLFIIDGAHNEGAALRLRESLDIYLADKNKIFIMAMFKDKAVEKVVSILADKARMLFTCTGPDNPRNISSKDLAGIVSKYNENVYCCDCVDEAIKLATSKAEKNDAIIAFGTISYLKSILGIYNVE